MSPRIQHKSAENSNLPTESEASTPPIRSCVTTPDVGGCANTSGDEDESDEIKEVKTGEAELGEGFSPVCLIWN
jgi:hypothetical protein